MKTTHRIVSGLTFCVTLFASKSHLAAELPPQSYANPEQLKEMYMSMNSMIHNYQVSYTHTLLDCKPASASEPKEYVPFEAVEILREGPRFWARSTGLPQGFDVPEKFGQMAFDGTASSIYFPTTNVGNITPGRANRAKESLDQFLAYMMTYKVNPDTDANRTRLDVFIGRNPNIRPRLEQLNGHWCHVVDSLAPNKAYGGLVWMAADKGGLPIKAERYAGGKCVERRLITEVGSLDTDTGTFYYPKKATKEFDDMYGYRRYELQTVSVRLNVESSPEMFRVTFPPGTDVVDRVRDIYYTTGPITEKSRFGALKTAIQNENQNAPSSLDADTPAQPKLAQNPNVGLTAVPSLEVAQPASSDFDDEESRTPLVLALLVAVVVVAVILVLFVRSKAKRATAAQ